MSAPPCANDTGRGPAWIWPWRPSPGVGHMVLRVADAAAPMTFGRAWRVVALAVGAVPVLLGYWLGSRLHQPATALLLTPLFLACLVRDRLDRAIVLAAVVIGTHS